MHMTDKPTQEPAAGKILPRERVLAALRFEQSDICPYYIPIQPESMDIFTLKRKYGRYLCFAGGISTQQTLPFGTPEQVRAETRWCIEVMGEGGGYVVAPAKPILPGVPLANAVALIDSIVGR